MYRFIQGDAVTIYPKANGFCLTPAHDYPNHDMQRRDPRDTFVFESLSSLQSFLHDHFSKE